MDISTKLLLQWEADDRSFLDPFVRTSIRQHPLFPVVSFKVKHSSWRTVLCGVPQGSVLGPLLFVIFISDIDDGILSKISKFADDTKLCRAVGDDQEAAIQREDLRRMFRWSQDWQMLFNLEKCSVMHMGRETKSYRMKWEVRC